jgi:hypothetical protein
LIENPNPRFLGNLSFTAISKRKTLVEKNTRRADYTPSQPNKPGITPNENVFENGTGSPEEPVTQVRRDNPLLIFQKISILFSTPWVVLYQDIVTTEQVTTQHVQGDKTDAGTSYS